MRRFAAHLLPRARFLPRDLLASLRRLFGRSGVSRSLTFGHVVLPGRDSIGWRIANAIAVPARKAEWHDR